jgi:dipeptidyl aminopeptidase/acylaminoacyl peptidase
MATTGCLPNRGAVSPDGRTFYFTLNKDAGFEAKEGTNVYALDLEAGRIRAMTDGPETKGWCSVSSDGKFLIYGTLAGGGGTVNAMDLEGNTTIPVTGITQNYVFPWVVPGEPPYVVAMAQKSKDERHWVLVAERGDVPLTPLAEYTAGLGNVGLATSRFAVPAFRKITEGDKEKGEASVWVVDLSNPPAAEGDEKAAAPKADAKPPAAKPWPMFTCAAKWVDIAGKDAPAIDLAFSPDGKRLLAAVAVAGEGGPQTQFFDIDPAGKEQPKLLFEVSGGASPQWTPDGKGLVYLRPVKGAEKGREVLLWQPEMKEARVIARLPDVAGSAYTTCFWTKEGRLRIYHVADEGLWLMDAAADGTGAKARRLSHERLAAQKFLADFERGIARMPDAPPQDLPEALAGAMKPVIKPLQDAAKPTQDALKAAWAAASAWEEVPAVAAGEAEKLPAKPAAEEKPR